MLLTINKNNKNTDTFVTNFINSCSGFGHTSLLCLVCFCLFGYFFWVCFFGGVEGVLLYFILFLVPLIH